MTGSRVLLITKLYPPSARGRSNILTRPRLIEQLNQAFHAEGSFLLISAPAGYGKTTLLADWLSQSQKPVAWLLLDEADNEPTRFWHYFVAALQTAQVNIGDSVQALLQSNNQQSFPQEAFLTLLLNELASLPDEFALVLEDYQLISSLVIHEGLAFLLEHLPPRMHLIITTRADPPLPLARLRAHYRLTEFRADDLRFTPVEIASFLNQIMGLGLSAEDITALEVRTEGWIVGLQLVALSLQGREETARQSFISAFTGNQRYILDYLLEEVLQRLPQNTQAFLLQTSILDRLCGSLCDTLTDRTDSQTMLEELERANLFLIPLDEQRHWYRYHHLFAEALRHQLQQAQARLKIYPLPELHRKAAGWLEAQGLIDQAIFHALGAGEPVWAARLVEYNVEEVLRRGDGETLRRWMAAIPQDIVRSRPRLALQEAITAFNAGQLTTTEALLNEAERNLATLSSEPYEPSIGREWSILINVPVGIALVRGTLAGLRGDVAKMTNFLQWANSHVAEEERAPRYSIRWNLALAAWLGGKMDEAEQAYNAIVAEAQAAEEFYLMFSGGALLGRVQRARGHLDQALQTYQTGLDEFTARSGTGLVLSAAMAQVGMAEVFYERNQLEQALNYLTQALPLARQFTAAQTLATGLATMAWIKQAKGDSAGALEAMNEAYRVMPVLENVALHSPVPSERARLLLAQGQLLEAARWVEARGLSETEELDYPKEAEYLILVRLLHARNWPHQALTLIDRLEALAKTQERTGSLIEIQILKALALETTGEHPQALTALTQALALARPQGYVRTFIDEGTPLAELLRQIKGEQRSYAELLLRELERWQTASPALVSTSIPLVEPLTERELGVLQLLVNGLSNVQIAQKLYLSVGTVKVHLKHIYGKLNVNSRVQAAARARELELF